MDPAARLDRRFSVWAAPRNVRCPTGFPSQRPAYSSRTGVAFWRKSGSRGKIHERYRHGLIASAASHRHDLENEPR